MKLEKGVKVDQLPRERVAEAPLSLRMKLGLASDRRGCGAHSGLHKVV